MKIKEFIHDFDRSQVLRHLLFAIVMGVAGACASFLLCIFIDSAYKINQEFPWLLYILPLLGIVTLILYKRIKLDLYLSTAEVVDKMRKNEPISAFLAPGILLGTCLSVLGGASVGKESAALQMGASIGEAISKPFKLKAVRKSNQSNIQYGYPASTGMAATFAALFFAPLGSAFFVWELSRYKRTIAGHFPTLLLACFIGAAIARVVGIGDIIPRIDIPDLTVHTFFMTILVAMICGIVGALFGTFLRKTERFNKRFIKNPYISVIIGGIAIIVLVHFCGWYQYEGMGGNLLTIALAGEAGTWDFAIKALMTILALGFIYKGGEIMPMFTIGTLLGCTMGAIVNVPMAFGAMIGMATFFCGATRCPLAAFFIGIETFGLASIPFLFIGVICAYAASFDFGIYGHGAYREIKVQAEGIPGLNKLFHYVDGAPLDSMPNANTYVEPFEAAIDPLRFMSKKQKQLLQNATAFEENHRKERGFFHLFNTKEKDVSLDFSADPFAADEENTSSQQKLTNSGAKASTASAPNKKPASTSSSSSSDDSDDTGTWA